MSALQLQWNESTTVMPELSKTHIEVLIELLRNIDYGKRTEMLIDAQSMLTDTEEIEIKFQTLRMDLEMELSQIRRMILMVEKAEYFMKE